MYNWLAAAVLFTIWLTGKFIFGKGGFIHILLLCGIAVAFVQLIAELRAAGQR